MSAEELRRVAYQSPFKPFRVKLVNGETIEINRSLRAAIAEDRAVFGVDEDPQRQVARRMRMVALRDIAEVELTSVI